MIGRMGRRSLVALSLVLLLVGCSDADDGGSSTTSRPVGLTTAAPHPSSGEAAGPGPEHRVFCEGYGELDRLFDELPDGTLAEVRSSVGTFAEEAAALADGAPDEVVDDAQVMATYFAELRDVVEAAATMEEAESAGADLDSADEFQAAGQSLFAWTEENCPA